MTPVESISTPEPNEMGVEMVTRAGLAFLKISAAGLLSCALENAGNSASAIRGAGYRKRTAKPPHCDLLRARDESPPGGIAITTRRSTAREKSGNSAVETPKRFYVRAKQRPMHTRADEGAKTGSPPLVAEL